MMNRETCLLSRITKLNAILVQMATQTHHSVNPSAKMTMGIHLSVYDAIEPLEELWREWQVVHHTTLFQSFDWCAAWLRQNPDTQLSIVTGTHADGTFAFLLPFQIIGGRIQFLGQQENIYGYGIFDDWSLRETGQHWFEENWPSLFSLVEHARLVDLQNMPDQLNGFRNPLLCLANFTDANSCTILNLSSDFDALLSSRRGREARAKMRNRDKRLGDLGEVKFEALSCSPSAHAALDELLHDQALRLRENGISDPVNGTYRDVLHQMLDTAGTPLRVLKLTVGQSTVASLLTAYHNDAVTFLMISLTAGPHRKYSPGDLALRRAIAHSIELGFRTFDFSRGDASYKEHWRDQTIALHHCARSLGFSGLGKSASIAARHGLRRFVRGTPTLWNGLYAARRMLRGKTSS
jgi:CelD/BcsL family acetyltransferase involved in cellulose biosynthesis